MSDTQTHTILVIDDDANFLRFVQWMLEESGYAVLTAMNHDQAIGRIEEAVPDVVLLDRHLETEDGLDLIAPLQSRVPSASIILMTAESSTSLAVQAVKLGAYDFLVKPIDEARLFTLLTNAIERGKLLDEIGSVPDEHQGFEGIIGQSAAMRTVFSIIKNVAPTHANVMILGESGTGKELIANALHSKGANPDGPFVPINMATLPAELVESTLFGHEKGAFTGADAQRIGACEEANGGTLFLDEITEMPLELQSKLLRFLQEKSFRRVGGSKNITSSARIVSASNRDPLQAISDGVLREDLYYRLNVIPIDLPPLRERTGDVMLLADHWLSDYRKTYNKQFTKFATQAIHRLTEYDWPGNIRQLKHTVERAVILNDGIEVDASMIELPTGNSTPVETESQVESEGITTPEAAYAEASTNGHQSAMFTGDEIIPLRDIEQRAIQHAIEHCDGSASEAAKKLGISSATIYRKIKSYNI